MPALLFVQSVCQRSRGCPIYQTQNLQPRQPSGIFRRLALCIVKISRHGNHRSIHRLLEIRFGPRFQFPQDVRGNFWGRERLVTQHHADHVVAFRVNPERKNLQFILNVHDAATHQAFHRVNSPLRLGQQTIARIFADNHSALCVHTHHRRTQRRPVRSRNSPRCAALLVQVRDQTVRRPQIDSDYPAHDSPSPLCNIKIPATTTPPQFPSALHPPNSECNSVGSVLRSSAPTKLTASRHPLLNQTPHPIAYQAIPVPHLLPSISPENSVPLRPVVHAKPPHLRPRLAHLAIHPAIRSTRKPLRAVPTVPAASSFLPCAPSKIPADTRRASADRVACGTRHSIRKSVPTTNSARNRGFARNCRDAASK